MKFLIRSAVAAAASAVVSLAVRAVMRKTRGETENAGGQSKPAVAAS